MFLGGIINLSKRTVPTLLGQHQYTAPYKGSSRLFSSLHKVTLIEGDGIGPEIAEAVIKVFKGANAPIEWEHVDVKPIKLPSGKITIPDSVFKSLNNNKTGLKGRYQLAVQ